MILVGLAQVCVRTKIWRWNQSAHLFCDMPANLEELHEFAERLGLKRSWFQDEVDLPHYDVTVTKRKKAVTAGAVPVDRKTEVNYIRSWRRLK